jgi:hypothetical protein
MLKRTLCISVAAAVALAYQPISANTPTTPTADRSATVSSTVNTAEDYISKTYNEINFAGKSKISAEVFRKAMTGYLNLKNAGKLGTSKNILSVVDFTLASKERRLWIIDLNAKKVIFNELVAHGQGSGNDFATAFSNDDNSHQSSLGFYVTGETYQGGHGLSLRLNGMDNGFNNAALARGIVVHGADYVNNGFIASQNRIGRSWGCPAVNSAISSDVIRTIKGGSCLFIYANDKKYNQTAFWLNKKVDQMPGIVAEDARQIATATPAPAKRDTVNVYVPAPAHNAPVSMF